MLDVFRRLRRELHQHPELSGMEFETAARIQSVFEAYQPESIHRNFGGTGVAVVFDGIHQGPTVLLRCELDALPIAERNNLPYRSARVGVAHQCGHDGHMAILSAVGAALAANRPRQGRVILLFQPSEEIGQGAEAILKDPRFAAIQPDFAFALHNVPGFPLGQILLRRGVMCCASQGMTARISGVTAHAAQPEFGVNPTDALCRFIQGLNCLPSDLAPVDEVVLATIVGARLGEKHFGTAPGDAEVWTTLRTETDGAMAALREYAEQLLAEAAEEGLQISAAYEDVFDATVNSSQAVDLATKAVASETIHWLKRPFRWSEDFGKITAISQGALIGIGAGEDTPALHNPDYDFPDDLIPIARDFLLRLLERCFSC